MLTVELLVKLSEKNINQLAREAGIRPSVLSDLLHHRGDRRWSKYYVEKISKALGVDSSMLVATVSDKDIIDLVEEKSKVGDVGINTSAPTPIHRPKKAAAHPDYSAAEAEGLEVYEDVEEAPTRTRIYIWPHRIAASPPDHFDPDEAIGSIWVDHKRGKRLGKNVYALQVTGESMNKIITPRDVVLVHRTSHCREGEIAIVAQDGGVTIKRRRGRQLVSESDQHFAPIDLYDTEDDGGGNRVVGRVFGIHKPK